MKRAGRLTLNWIAGIAIALIGTHAILTAITGARMRAAYKALEDAGRPMTAAEIIPPEIPESENAAPLYLEAFEALKDLKDEEWFVEFEDIAAEKELPTNGLAVAKEALSRPEIQEVLQLLKKAAAKPQCRFERDWSAGAGLLLPEVAQTRNAARVVKMSALANDAPGAVDDLILGLNLAAHLDPDPILICQLVKIAIANMMLETAQDVFQQKTVADADATRLSARIASMRGSEGFIRSFDGERVLLGEWAFNLFTTRKGSEELASLAGDSSPVVMFYGGRLLKPLWQADHAAYLRLMHAMTQEAIKPVYEAESIDDKLEEMIPRYCILTRVLLPALGKMGRINADAEAKLTMTQTGIALIRHKTRHGAYPEDTAAIDNDLLAKWPTDPFTGKPFIYRSTAEGAVLYSVGINGKDDGGTKSQKRDEGDVVWELPGD